MNDYFESVYYENKDDVYRLALSYTQNKDDAEDITQKVFIKIFKNIRKINNDKTKQYILKITSNECKDFFKSFWRKKIIFFDNDMNNDILKDFSKETIELLDILQKLPLKYRISIHLYYFYGYSVKEISEIENSNENAVKSRLSRGRKILKSELERIGLYEKII